MTTAALRLAVAAAVIVLAVVLLAGWPGHALAGAGEACREQAALAEQAAGIPPGLLLAIGKRESGRADVQSGGVLPWPWSVNREGEDHVFESPAEAIAYVAAAQGAGSRSIDVGCFQINLKYHPSAFASLEEAFDPAANAAYAARFLAELHARAGSWATAVAWYHSATPWEGEPYRDAVLATWRGLADIAAPVGIAALPGPLHLLMGIRIWEPTPLAAVARAPDSAPAKVTRMTAMPVVFPHPVHGLPVVITPATASASGASLALAEPVRLRRFSERVR